MGGVQREPATFSGPCDTIFPVLRAAALVGRGVPLAHCLMSILGTILRYPQQPGLSFHKLGSRPPASGSSTDAKMAGYGTSSGVGQSWDPQGGNFLKSSPCPCPTGRKEPQINPATAIAEVRAEGLGTDSQQFNYLGTT